MSFTLSPGVNVQEQDLTNIVPAVSTSTAAIVGAFLWGPILEITSIANETNLASKFGAPTNANYKDFLVAASFLAYAKDLKVVRVAGTSGLKNAAAEPGSTSPGWLVTNSANYNSQTFGTNVNIFIAKYAGTFGDNLGVAWADSTGFIATDSNGDFIWPWHSLFNSAPATNEFHVVVYDATGVITGTANTMLEVFPFVSTVSSAVYYDGTSGYFVNRINNGSSWIWTGNPALLTGTNDGITMTGGNNGTGITDGNYEAGYDLFSDPQQIDISLILQGGASTNVGAYIIQDIASVRLDCVAYVSPAQTDVVNIFDDSTILSNILATRNTFGSSSYAVMDSAYKLMYDRYNDVNRWVPLNGDIAGLCAQTDSTNAPWFSPAGRNRGNIKNCIALSNPQNQADRDTLYNAGINPVIVLPNQGPVLYGDKTLQSRPSAFDRINVRRLFIVLEKAIATAASFFLFELNDAQTQQRFANTVEPFLRQVQAQQGVTDFAVVCDSTVNTPFVVDANQFVANIYLKPTRSINWINLTFTAVGTGVSFDEIIQGATISG